MNFFKFCPNCKTRLKLSDRAVLSSVERLIDCAVCGFYFYINPSPTNGLILENEIGEILLVKRKIQPKKGYWDIPGGFIDFDETLEESLKREIREELSIEIYDLKYFASTADRYLYQGINYHTLCFIMKAKANSLKKISPQDDIGGYKFFSKKNFPLERLAFSGLKEFFKKYLFSTKQSPSAVKR